MSQYTLWRNKVTANFRRAAFAPVNDLTPRVPKLFGNHQKIARIVIASEPWLGLLDISLLAVLCLLPIRLESQSKALVSSDHK